MDHKITTTNITGRDAYILGEALAHAIVLMRGQEHPAHSDIADMQTLLDFVCPDSATQQFFLKEAGRHLMNAVHPAV